MSSFTIPGYGVVEELREEKGRYGPEAICKCPKCEKNALSINKGERAGVYRCWHCSITGKILEEVKAEEPEEKPNLPTFSPQELNDYIETLISTLTIDDTVNQYLNDHGITEKIAHEFRIGISKERPVYKNWKIAEAIGLVNNHKGKYTNRFYNRIVIGMKEKGQWVYVQGRKTTESQHAKFINCHGDVPLFNVDAIEDSKEVYLCEGWPDALSMVSHGNPNTVAALGAHNFVSRHAFYLGDKHVFLAGDNDEAGKIGTQKIQEILIKEQIKFSVVDLGKSKDVSQYLAGGGKIGADPDRKRLTYIRSGENLILFGFGSNPSEYDLLIGVSDVVERKQSLKTKVELTYKDGEAYKATVDLANIRSRASFSNAAYDLCEDVTKKELKQILNDLYAAVTQQIEQRKEEQAHPSQYVPTEEEQKMATEFLRSEKLLFRIKQYLRRQQVVGENINKILLYLIFTSRLMKKPISAIVKGLSSSGKTHLIKQVMTIIPEEGVFVTQEASAKAFFYVQENDLKHRMIVIGEMHGAEESEYSIREAQDGVAEGDLIITTVQKDKDTNEMMTKTKRVKGPCGFITSTTRPGLNPENETRNFSLFVQINEKKIKETDVILEEKYTGKDKSLSKEELLLLHNAQRCLEKDLQVSIPYVRMILDSFPTTHARVMRDRTRFFTVLETIAVLHQFQGNRTIIKSEDGTKTIEANLSDYALSMALMDEILVETLHEMPPKAKEIYKKVMALKKKWEETTATDMPDDIAENFSITYKEIAEEMGMKPEEARRWSKPLRDHGYLNYSDKGGGRGKETHLYPVAKTFYESFLPKPEEVAARFPQYYGEKLYDPITGDQWEIEQPKEEQVEF